MGRLAGHSMFAGGGPAPAADVRRLPRGRHDGIQERSIGADPGRRCMSIVAPPGSDPSAAPAEEAARGDFYALLRGCSMRRRIGAARAPGRRPTPPRRGSRAGPGLARARRCLLGDGCGGRRLRVRELFVGTARPRSRCTPATTAGRLRSPIRACASRRSSPRSGWAPRGVTEPEDHIAGAVGRDAGARGRRRGASPPAVAEQKRFFDSYLGMRRLRSSRRVGRRTKRITIAMWPRSARLSIALESESLLLE